MVLDSGFVWTNDEIISWVGRRAGEDCLVAIDAPMIVRNPPGTARACEAQLNSCFQRYEAGCHPSNTGMRYFADGTRAALIAAALGLNPDPELPISRMRSAIEVYPHPGHIVLFGLPKTLKYKRGRGRGIPERRAAFAVYLAEMEKLRTAHPPLDVTAVARWAELSDGLLNTTVKARMNEFEDELDAYFCAYLALYYSQHRAARCRIVGTLADGYIVTPVGHDHALCLDRWVPPSPS